MGRDVKAWWWALWGLLLVAPAPAGDELARKLLEDGMIEFRRGRPDDAWRNWTNARIAADSNYLALEALAQASRLHAVGTAAHASDIGRLMAYFQATPPRWLSDTARQLVEQQSAERVARGEWPATAEPLGVRSLNFAGAPTALGFAGRRYFWLADSGGIPGPPETTRVGGEAIQLGDVDRLPEPRIPVAGAGWAVTDPYHNSPDLAEAARLPWRYDRCLLGYTYEAIQSYEGLTGGVVWQPREPWYKDQQTIWQLRFRVFYPSTQLWGRDWSALAVHLLDTLLRGVWLGVESLGREAWDNQRRDEIIDVWLTPNAAEAWVGAAGETIFNNLLFYQIGRDRVPGEWVREAFHEYSHLMMPRIGRYTNARRYEPFLDGLAGERLLLAALDNVLRVSADEDLSPWLRALRLDGWYAGYRASEWAAPYAVWSRLGPEAPARQAVDDEGAAWLLGFLSWLAEVHDPRFIHDFWRGVGAVPQTAESLLKRYRGQLSELLEFSLSARTPVLLLSDTRPEATAEGLALGETDRVEYVVWLPPGRWSLRILTTAPAALTVALDGASANLLQVDSTPRLSPPVIIDAKGEWRRIALGGFGRGPAVVRSLHFTRPRIR